LLRGTALLEALRVRRLAVLRRRVRLLSVPLLPILWWSKLLLSLRRSIWLLTVHLLAVSKRLCRLLIRSRTSGRRTVKAHADEMVATSEKVMMRRCYVSQSEGLPEVAANFGKIVSR